MLLLSRNKIGYVIIKEHVCTCTYCKLEVHLKMLFKVDTFKEGLSNFFTNISYQLFWKNQIMHFCQNNCKTRLRASSSVPGQTVWLGYCPTTNVFLKIKVGFHCSVQTINLLVLVPLKKKN